MQEEKRINFDPRISLNKLGEFLTTNPSRRRRILMDQKYPNTFIVARYNDAEDSISKYISSDTNDLSILDRNLQELESKNVTTEWEAQTRSLNYEAIDTFYDFTDELEFQNCTFCRVNKNSITPMSFGNVTISVRPEILVYHDSKDIKQIGAIKLYFSKNNSLTQQSGEYIASMLMEYLRKTENDHVPLNKLCCVIDVFAQQIYFAPASYKRRMADVTAACQEIAAIWSTL
jgi:hypothetical protein